MEFQKDSNQIFSVDGQGRLIAEITFPDEGENMVNLNHTFVNPAYKGQGLAGQLVKAAAEQIKAEGKRIRPTCSYALKWFDKHEEYQDILVTKKER